MDQDLASLEQQIVGLSTLIMLENKARNAADKNEFGFIIANESIRIFQYHQAIFFTTGSFSNAKIETISGVPNHDPHSLYVLWLKRLLTYLNKKKSPLSQITKNDVPPALKNGWQEWASHHTLYCPFSANGYSLGGLLFLRDDQWTEPEIGLVQQVVENYSYALFSIKKKKKWWQFDLRFSITNLILKICLPLVILCALFLPIRLSVLAPAKIVAIAPHIISSPLKGVIKNVFVQPNQSVKAGQLLFSLEGTDLKNRLFVAQKAKDVVEAELKRSRQKSLLNASKASDVDLIEARLKEKTAQVSFAAEQLALISIKSDTSGIVLFDDANDWIGKPVVTGERIMTVASSDNVELEIEVPISNAINLEAGAVVKMFPNINPTLPINGNIRQTSYEAHVTQENTLAFMVKATIKDQSTNSRIGLRGTAKIYGKDTKVYYYLFRRPLSTLRMKFGL